jgi:hypothetical protein
VGLWLSLMLILPPVPPVLMPAGWFTGGTGGKSEILSNQHRNFRPTSGAHIGAYPARPRVGVVAATGTELRHIPRIEVRPASLAPGGDHPVSRHNYQPGRQGLLAGIADPDAGAVLVAAGLDLPISLTAEGAGYQ